MNLALLAALNLLAPFAALGVAIKFLLSPRRRLLRDLPDELGERFGSISEEARRKLAGRPVLWVHAASAGEVAAVDEFLRLIKLRADAPAVLLTTMTAAGRRAAQALPHVDAASLAPIDCWPAVSRLLGAAKPYALILVETELWPHMVELAHRSGARVGLVNGRISDRSFPRYAAIRFCLRPLFGRIVRLAAQTAVDRERFALLGARADALSVSGNMKYDRADPSADRQRAHDMIERLGWSGRTIMVAGSTHPGEHEIVLSAFNTAKKRFPDLRLVLAPRHLEKTAAVESALRASGVMYSRWSQPRTDSECLLLDAMGLLRAFYGEATLAFVGGSLAAVGGHNLLEPALAGTPVFFGPHTENARQAAELLISSGCGFVVKNEAELGEGICAALGDPRRIEELRSAVKAMSATLRGATERTLAWLGPVISPTPRLYNCPSGQ